jgi:antitoxin (DNA-binding transcriptional repressor) of toxin-antitoxin stability system
MGSMQAVGLKALKNNLSQYVRLASGGETVLVTDRDRVVAELGPPRAGHLVLLSDARLAEAVRKGWLTPALAPDIIAPPRAPILPIAELLAELRGDRDAR